MLSLIFLSLTHLVDNVKKGPEKVVKLKDEDEAQESTGDVNYEIEEDEFIEIEEEEEEEEETGNGGGGWPGGKKEEEE